MRGYIEVKEDTYDDVIEHLRRVKLIVCKLIKRLEEDSDTYKEDSHIVLTQSK